MKIETLAVHAGRQIDPGTGAVTPPIHLSTTFERSPSGEYPLGFSYAREGNPSRRSLEECLAAMEGGKESLAFSSGLAVATALVQGLEPGDHIIAPDDVYYGLRQLIGGIFGKWPVETSYVDMTDLDAVREAVRPNTRLVLIETPSNPLLKITDLEAVAQIARKANAISVCDATFTTPVVQRPLDWGIDMVWHSTTKYIGGHSDATGGALITRCDNYLFERARKSLMFGGAAPSPFDCWLTLRGISTLPWRMRAHCANAKSIAGFLQTHPAVERVFYPGLPPHPGYATAQKQMPGGGGMLSFQVHGGREEAMGVAARVRLFTRATSLGGTHSLIEHRASIEGPGSKTPQNLLRCSIGLENAQDLIEDLAQALTR
ncbi:MAG: aminotransferase class I/II-fold pyridoxal phosphate-dependent enzyme [Bryobacterales bacterium]|nr:aminotransferase class I/II-fold pyridoxal phosphate-dependent enzyme [Bryobacterales bacterium]MBV9400662.1 aminotransferase class I/II-fold pyridoxal phosphate-dependent enzyme [Bryobacterales bacterium]